MNAVVVGSDSHTATILGGARAADVVAVTDRVGLAPVTGSVGDIAWPKTHLGRRQRAADRPLRPCIGSSGRRRDVLADGRVIIADPDHEDELFWALRGGGNFGVVTEMHHRLHHLSSVRSGLLLCPFADAKAVLEGCADVAASGPEELTAQVGFVASPDGVPLIMIVPTWCGDPRDGEARLSPFLKLGTLGANTVGEAAYGAALTVFDPYLASGQLTFMETCWLPVLDSGSAEGFIQAMGTAVSPGCAMFTHEFKERPRECRWRRRPSFFAATMFLSRFSPPSSIGRTNLRSDDTSDGFAPHFEALMGWRFLADTRT